MDSGLKTVHEINIQRSLDISLLGSLATDQPVSNKKFAFSFSSEAQNKMEQK